MGFCLVPAVLCASLLSLLWRIHTTFIATGFFIAMADTLLLRALKGQPKSLNLSSKNITQVPRVIGKLSNVNNLQLKNNRICDLPTEISSLTKLTVLNLGNNCLEKLPEPLATLHSLEKLHLFGNQIKSIDAKIFGDLRCLTFLNLNNNQIKVIPSAINRLVNLQYLSLDGNRLTGLPSELCALSKLTELHAAGNQLKSLPLEIGFLVNLKRLHVQKNKIKELPEGLGKLIHLEIIDVAANEIKIFPTELHKLPLKELYCEENPLLDALPVHSIQEEEILTLKEITARHIMKQLKDRWSYMRRAIRHYPNIRDMLAQASKCALCGSSFLNTWLECVRFVDGRKDLKLTNSPGRVPIRALLCSYKCFNTPDHGFYGIAFP